MLNIVIFGAPGSGKGTHSARLVEEFKLDHISTGDVLRTEIKNGTELGKIAQGYIDHGQLIPDELMIVIFDGFPRTIAQAEALKQMLEERGQKITAMIDIQVSEDILMARLLRRATLEGRADDNEETIKKRFAVYHNQTAPLVEWFKEQGVYKAFPYSEDLGLDGMVKVINGYVGSHL